MSAPSKACNIKLVKIRLGERLAITPKLTFAPDKVTYLREAEGKGYRATTQVKGLSSEINHHVGGRSFSFSGRQKSCNRNRQGYKNPTESETVALYQRDIAGTWENQYIPGKVCGDKPTKGKESQMIYWWSDKSIVAKKFRNGNGAKGLTGKPKEGNTSSVLRDRDKMAVKPEPMTYPLNGKEVFLKSRMWENYKYGSVRGFIMNSENIKFWRWL